VKSLGSKKQLDENVKKIGGQNKAAEAKLMDLRVTNGGKLGQIEDELDILCVILKMIIKRLPILNSPSEEKSYDS